MTGMSEWEIERNVKCVSCPDCGFTFDALHTDNPSGYSCPACAEIALTAERDRLKEALEQIVEGHDNHQSYAMLMNLVRAAIPGAPS